MCHGSTKFIKEYESIESVDVSDLDVGSQVVIYNNEDKLVSYCNVIDSDGVKQLQELDKGFTYGTLDGTITSADVRQGRIGYSKRK